MARRVPAAIDVQEHDKQAQHGACTASPLQSGMRAAASTKDLHASHGHTWATEAAVRLRLQTWRDFARSTHPSFSAADRSVCLSMRVREEQLLNAPPTTMPTPTSDRRRSEMDSWSMERLRYNCQRAAMPSSTSTLEPAWQAGTLRWPHRVLSPLPLLQAQTIMTREILRPQCIIDAAD